MAPPAEVLRAYPQAFLVNCADDKTAAEQKADLVKAVRRGDILFFSGWWPSPENAIVKSIYEEARMTKSE